jgi:putative ABC transport system ATP-binding protein
LARRAFFFLDEHTAALDPKTAEFVLGLTREIVGELQLTTVMVTHSMAQALQFAPARSCFIGRIIFDVAGEKRSQISSIC